MEMLGGERGYSKENHMETYYLTTQINILTGRIEEPCDMEEDR